MNTEPNVYFVTQAALSRGRSTPDVVRAAVEGGVDVVQLREKGETARHRYELGRELRALTAGRGGDGGVPEDRGGETAEARGGDGGALGDRGGETGEARGGDGGALGDRGGETAEARGGDGGALGDRGGETAEARGGDGGALGDRGGETGGGDGTVPLIVNDRVDVAAAIDADGVHLGDDDLPVPAARRILGAGATIGRSVSTVAGARAAVEAGADYLGVGAVYATDSKDVDADEAEIGLGVVREVAAAVDVPIVGIGGITANNAADVVAAGADGVAVVSAIAGADDPAAATRALADAVADGRARR